ncbi:SRPBCC family protein [Luteimonas sp. e5]
MSDAPIQVETRVKAPLQRIWQAWNTPADICCWNVASADWHTPAAELDLREGGRFCSRMEARDGSMGFDFSGRYALIEPLQRIEYHLDDGRAVRIDFIDHGDGTVSVREAFDAEQVMSREQQRQGWQAILDNFKRHVEAAA